MNMGNPRRTSLLPRKETLVDKFRKRMDRRKKGYNWYNLSHRQQYWFRGLWVDVETTYEEWEELIMDINIDMTSEDVMLGMETHDITDTNYQKATDSLIEILNGRN